MRISDWSSDVCSSDLVNRRKKDMSSDLADLLGRLLQPDPNVRLKESSELQQPPWIADELHLSPPTMDRSIISHVPESTEADRKTLVQGQRVTVRVDPGRPRTIKKKNTNTQTTT